MRTLEELNGNYKRLFDAKDSESGGDTKSNKRGFAEVYGWLITLDNISNNDRTKWDYFQQMNAVEFLNYLAYVKSKAKEQERQQRLQNMMRR